MPSVPIPETIPGCNHPDHPSRSRLLRKLAGLLVALSVANGIGMGTTLSARAAAPHPRQLTEPTAPPPNLILILCDDLGYADIGVQGAKHPTPNLDRMAAEGVRLTNFYSAANVCTPTRASIMTGCYPRRVGLHENDNRNWVLFPGDRRGIHPDEVTLAELLKARGFATACIGKWHLGSEPMFLPTRHGFDFYFGIPYSNDMGRTERPKSTAPPLPLIRGESVIETEPDQRLLTKRYTEEAIAFIKAHKDQPFFLYLPHTMPHWPQFASETFAGKSGNGRYGDSVTEIDWSTGEILKTLKENRLDERTLVVFTSDNGGPVRQGATNTPLRAAKGTIYEGGHRVPFLARWPGRLAAGVVRDAMAVTFDLYPTFARLAGAAIPADRVIDGKDIWPILAEGAVSPHEAFFYYHVGTLAAVRDGPWKLIVEHDEAPQGRPNQTTRIPSALYNLHDDISESHDLKAEHPDVVRRLSTLADRAREDLGDGTREGKRTRPPGMAPPRASRTPR